MATVAFLLEQPSPCGWMLNFLAWLSELREICEHPNILSPSWFCCLKLHSPAKNGDLGIWLPWWELMRSSKECVKCEQLMEKKPEKGVLLFFHKTPFQKQVMHDIYSAQLWGNLTISLTLARFSVSLIHKFTKYVKNFSTLASPTGAISLSKFWKRRQLMSN